MALTRILTLAAALVFVLPSVESAAGETVFGSLQFDHATFSGETASVTSDLSAFHSSADEGVPLRASWSLDAAHVLVNWTRHERAGTGSSPTDPGNSLVTAGPQWEYGDDSHQDASLSSEASTTAANLLILPNPGTPLRLETGTESSIDLAQGDGARWTAGAFDQQSTALGNSAIQLTQSYDTTPGVPVLQGADGLMATISGSFSIYVWGANVTVQDGSNQTRTYQSGAWHDNQVGPGPRGAVRDEHWQFLRVHVTDAVLRLTHETGLVEWTAPSVETRTEGTASYVHADGTLESAERIYTANQSPLTIEGRITQESQATTNGLLARIHADGATVSTASTAIPKTPGSEYVNVLWWVLALAGLLVLVAGAVWGLRRLRAATDWRIQLARAEDAFERRRFHASDRRLARLLQRDQIPAPGAQADAWFLRGAARLELGDPGWLLREAAPRMDQLGNPSMLAYLLTLAAMEVGDAAAARRWFGLVRQDALVMQAFLEDPRLRALRKRWGFVWERGTEAAGYA